MATLATEQHRACDGAESIVARFGLAEVELDYDT